MNYYFFDKYKLNKMHTDPVLDMLSVKTSHYIIAGTAFVTALTWNETIKKVINRYIPVSEQIQANVTYALVLTLILVLMIYFLPNTEKELPDFTKEKLQSIRTKHIYQVQK